MYLLSVIRMNQISIPTVSLPPSLFIVEKHRPYHVHMKTLKAFDAFSLL